jgi:polar amino acid transport system substrate-binding protein
MLLLVGLVMGWGAEAQDRVVRLATLEDYAPYSAADRPDMGFAPDVFVQAMRRRGHVVSVEVMPWARALEAVREGRFHALTSVWHSAERENFLLFSQPFALQRLVFVRRAGSVFDFRRLEDLRGRRVGTVYGFFYQPDFMAASFIQRQEAPNVLTNLRLLAADRIDLTLDDEGLLRFLLNTQLPELRPHLELTQGALTENPLYMGFSRVLPEGYALVEDFNAGLRDLQADGTYSRLLEKHAMR